MDVKPFWASKTMWANGIALIGSVTITYGFELSTDLQAELVAGVMAVVNIVLRLTTKSAVSLK